MTQPLSTFTVPLPELKTAQLTHGRLTYRETGEGKKRQNLLFLHGLLGNAKSWSYQFQDRSLGQNYRLMAWDAPGFGGSDLVEAHIDAYLAALAEFVDHVAEGPIFLVGHSMGGKAAMVLALTRLRPGTEIAFDLPVNGQLRTIRFDRDAIAKAGYNDIVIMAVTNSTEYPQMKKEPDQPVVAGETPIVIF